MSNEGADRIPDSLPSAPGSLREQQRALSLAPKAAGRRFGEVAAFAALWMALGWGLRLSTEAYLALGAPLTLAFQWLVRRRPIRELWVRDGPPFRLDVAGWLIAVGLASVVALNLLGLFTHGVEWGKAAWAALALAGTLPAAYALRALDRKTASLMVACVAVAVPIGTAILALSAAAAPHHAGRLAPALGMRIAGLILEFWSFVPVVCVMEEVSFRGAFDAYVYQPGDRRPWLSAMAVSALWGLWHLPISPGPGSIWAKGAGLVMVHTLVGVPLSLYWRRSGNLLVPGVSHALLDAIRDTFFMV